MARVLFFFVPSVDSEIVDRMGHELLLHCLSLSLSLSLMTVFHLQGEEELTTEKRVMQQSVVGVLLRKKATSDRGIIGSLDRSHFCLCLRYPYVRSNP